MKNINELYNDIANEYIINQHKFMIMKTPLIIKNIPTTLDIQMYGSFNDWNEPIDGLYYNQSYYFNIKLEKGIYQIKFKTINDNIWYLSNDLPKTYDTIYENNLLIIN
jgi:hypothetical protein